MIFWGKAEYKKEELPFCYIKKEVGMRVFVLENNHFIGDMGVQHRRACIIRKLVTHIHMAMSI